MRCNVKLERVYAKLARGFVKLASDFVKARCGHPVHNIQKYGHMSLLM